MHFVIVVLAFLKLLAWILSPILPSVPIGPFHAEAVFWIGIAAIAQVLIAERMGLGFRFFVALAFWLGAVGVFKMYPEFGWTLPIAEVLALVTVGIRVRR